MHIERQIAVSATYIIPIVSAQRLQNRLLCLFSLQYI